jgi:MoxR-like ATPase
MSTPSKKTLDPKKPAPVTDWSLIERVLRSPSVRTVYLWGGIGNGKTYAATRFGLRGPLYALTMTEETPAAEIRGHYLPVGDHMEWRDGPVVLAMRTGGRLVINELTHASPDCFSFLHPVLENPDTAILTLPTGETVTPAPNFQAIITDNLPPEELPPALRDRFDCTLEVREPHPAALAQLSPELRGLAIRAATLDPERHISPRGWLSVQRLQAEFGIRDAMIAVFGPARGAHIHDALVLASARN